MREGDSIDNAIVIDAHDYISGVLEEHNYIDRKCSNLNTDIESVEQNLIIENERHYDVFTLKTAEGDERIIYFDISSFFGRI